MTTTTNIDPANEERARSFLPRRGLPSGRAVVGALFVTVATVGTFAYTAADEPGPTTAYLVITADVGAGEPLTPDAVELVPMDLPPEVAASTATTRAAVEGSTALTDIRAGTLLDLREIATGPTVDGRPVRGVHELTIPVPADRAPHQLTRGDRVALLAYRDTDDVLVTAVEDAVVLGYESGAAGIGTRGDARLTLAVEDAEAVATVARWSYRDLTVVRTTHALDDRYPQRVGPPTTTIAPNAAVTP